MGHDPVTPSAGSSQPTPPDEGTLEPSNGRRVEALPATWDRPQSLWNRVLRYFGSRDLAGAGRSTPSTSLRGPGGRVDLGAGDEVVEHIPWDRITIDEPAGRSPVFYVMATLAVVLAAVAIWRFQGPDTMPTPITLADVSNGSPNMDSAPVDEEPAMAGEPGTEISGPTAARPAELAPSAQLTSEADLMAFVPIDGADAARVRAEWFVLDYFSTSDAARSEKVSAVVPEWASTDVEPTTTAYVDWVHAYDVAARSDRLFDVTVAYRSLVTTDDGPYVTGGVRAVVVPVAVRPDGASSVAGLPTPTAPPEALAVSPGTPPPPDDRWDLADPPAEVAEAALETVDGLVGAPLVLTAVTNGTAWRVVVEGEAAGGVRWPFEVFVQPPDGSVPARPVEDAAAEEEG